MDPRKGLSFVVWLFAACSFTPYVSATKCDLSNCIRPRCVCPSNLPPGKLQPRQVPQIVYFTLLGTMDEQKFKFIEELFTDDMKNPNYCPAAATFFVGDFDTVASPIRKSNYTFVKKLYERGHEVATTGTNIQYPVTWWHGAAKTDYVNEVVFQKIRIATDAEIDGDDINGFRVPFLTNGGDEHFGMLRDYNFSYDSSLVNGPYNLRDYQAKAHTPLYPFTLDVPPEKKLCDITPVNCPSQSYPGLWEVPLNRIYGNDGQACVAASDCNVRDTADTFNFLVNNFNRNFRSNRAPLGIYLQTDWFVEKPYALQGVKRFIGHVTGIRDAWIVTVSQLIEWMKNPKASSHAKVFDPWKNTRLPCTLPKTYDTSNTNYVNRRNSMALNPRSDLLLLVLSSFSVILLVSK